MFGVAAASWRSPRRVANLYISCWPVSCRRGGSPAAGFWASSTHEIEKVVVRFPLYQATPVATSVWSLLFTTATFSSRHVTLSLMHGADVDRHIDEPAALALLPAALTPHGSVAVLTFLDTYGFINFGLATRDPGLQDLRSTPPDRSMS
jgi:hypothetical protein